MASVATVIIISSSVKPRGRRVAVIRRDADACGAEVLPIAIDAVPEVVAITVVVHISPGFLGASMPLEARFAGTRRRTPEGSAVTDTLEVASHMPTS
jgi:hypothetical protein